MNNIDVFQRGTILIPTLHSGISLRNNNILLEDIQGQKR